MLRTVALIVPIAFLVLAGVRADEAKSPVVADEATRGGGYSQQYHYNSYPSHGGGGHDPYGYTYAGLSFDLSTGLFLALGAIIVLLALAAVIYPLLSKNSGYGDSYSSGGGWTGGAGGSSYGSYRSYNIAGTAEKVLSAIEKVYDAYNKSQ
jgi:hypothetical protein